MATSTPHGRTLAADLCPDWAHDGREYRHKSCPSIPTGGIRFAPPESWSPRSRSNTAHCPACGTRWHRFQSRWERVPPEGRVMPR